MKLHRLCCFAAIVLLGLAVSCGRDRSVLAKVGGREIGIDEYREAFAALSPEEQVEVLQPGGRTDLLQRLVTKNLLEVACDSEGIASASQAWIDLYETAWLSRAWSEDRYRDYMETGADSSSLRSLSGSFHLAIALVPDSSSASAALGEWTANGPAALPRTSLAPWSAGGSSFRIMDGMIVNLSPELESACLGRAGAGPFSFPIYGVWAVAVFDTAGPASDGLPEGIGTFSFFRDSERQAGIAFDSRAIESASEMLVPGPGGRYSTSLSGIEPTLVLASWDGGALTAGDLAGVLEAVSPDSFFGGEIPEELSQFALPDPSPAGQGVDLWFCVKRLAMARWEAGQAVQAGFDPDTSDLSTMASVENLLRREVLQAAGSPDSSAILDFYDRNRGSFLIPERRSVVLAYLPPEEAGSIGSPEDFEPLLGWTPLDQDGRPIPTPPQAPEAFGPMAGPIFAADSGVVTGPVGTGTDSLMAFFMVVKIAAPDTADASSVWPFLEAGARAESVEAAFSAYLSELRSRFGVEIDSTAVEAVDPWGSSY